MGSIQVSLDTGSEENFWEQIGKPILRMTRKKTGGEFKIKRKFYLLL